MAELLIVLMMAFNLWMVIYLTWERREENVPKEDKEKDVGAPERSGDIMGKSLFRMPERKPQAAAPMSNATVQAPGEEVDEKDVARTWPLTMKLPPPIAGFREPGRRAKCPTRNWTRCLPTSVFPTSGRNMTKTEMMTASLMKREA